MATTRRSTDDSFHDHPSFLLSQLGYVADRRFDAALAPLGLDRRQYGMLRLLADGDGATQQALGGALGIHRNVMVGLVDDLEERGLVERRRHPADRRAHAIHLTTAARRALRRATPLLVECDEGLLAGLDATERSELLSLLQRVAERVGLAPTVHPGMAAPDGASSTD